MQKRKLFDKTYIKKEKRRHLILACILFWSVIMAWVSHKHLLGSIVVQGESMEPSMVHGERHLFHKWFYLLNQPKKGDVVVYEHPYDGNLSVKRVIALPLDQIQFKDGRIYINNERIHEPYLSSQYSLSKALSNKIWEVPKNHYFVLGDNRENSHDSRNTGAVSQEKILGKIFV